MARIFEGISTITSSIVSRRARGGDLPGAADWGLYRPPHGADRAMSRTKTMNPCLDVTRNVTPNGDSERRQVRLRARLLGVGVMGGGPRAENRKFAAPKSRSPKTLPAPRDRDTTLFPALRFSRPGPPLRHPLLKFVSPGDVRCCHRELLLVGVSVQRCACSHRRRITHIQQRGCDHNPIITSNHPFDLLPVAPQQGTGIRSHPPGSAGLGVRGPC